MPMRFKLDFSIETSEARMEYLKQNVDFSKLTKKDIELCTDYVLYGKDPDGPKDIHGNLTSAADRGEVIMKPKYSSYQKVEPVSLEGLMESPTFDETIFRTGKNIYKNPKPEPISKNREKYGHIPGMKELWVEIDKLERIIGLAKGTIQPEPGEVVPQLDSKQLYHLNHQKIDLYKQQYLLQEMVVQEMKVQKNYGSFFTSAVDQQMNYPVFPCGTMSEENDPNFRCPFQSLREFKAADLEAQIAELEKNGKPYFNFLNKEHIYQLCLNYYDIKLWIKKYPDSPLWNLLWTLDYYIEKANLSEQQMLIVEGKKRRLLNKEICQELMDKLGIYHQENYISTIWNKVCQLIADAADLSYDEWCCKDYAPAWKKCNCCGKWLLRDNRNFVKKSKAPDGLTNRCKRCDQKKRRGEI